MKTYLTPWLWKLELIAFGLSLCAILAFRLRLLDWRPSLMLMAGALTAVVVIGFFSLLVLFAKLRSGNAQGTSRHCLLAALLALPVLIGILLLGMRGAKVPPIHDITTDPGNPPALTAAASMRAARDNSASYAGGSAAEQQQQAYPDIIPLTTAMPPAQAYEQALATVQSLGWQVVDKNQEQGTIEALDRSLLFGFIDDIAIRIRPDSKGSRIDLRSASRVGVSDLGVNAKRIRQFIQKFNSSKA